MTSTYVDRWPYRVDTVFARDVSSYQFLLEADQSRLDTFLERHFSVPSNGTIDLRSISRHVLLQVSTTERLEGGGAAYPNNYPDLGLEHAAALVLFATDRNNQGAFVMLTPYVIVDNALSMVNAREAFGLPKDMGTIAIDDDAQHDLSSINVDVLGVRDVSVPGARFQPERLLQVRHAGAPDPLFVNIGRTIGDIFEQTGGAIQNLPGTLHNMMQIGELGTHGLEFIVHGEACLLLLKQFHDLGCSADACYQEVVGLKSFITRRDGFHHLNGRYEVEFFDLGSHPLAADLGLSGTQPSLFSFWMGYEFGLCGRTYP